MHFTRESVFVSATRSFCNSFATVIGIILAAIFVFMGIGMLSSPDIIPIRNEIVIAPDADGNRDVLDNTAPVVLRINIHGVIGMDSLTATNIENVLLDSQNSVIKKDRVKAILLHMDTPGGTVTDSDGIYRLLMEYKTKYKVPVYAFVDGMCASGGMYICSAADKIYATNPSVIGSVGVIMGPTFNFSEVMEKVGIKSMTIKQGKDKDMLNPFRPWVPGEDQSLVNITKDLYDQFVEIVTLARKNLNKEELINEYGAQIFLAKQAKTLGYIDVDESRYAQVLNDLVTVAGISSTDKYQVVQLEMPTSFIHSIIQGKSALITGKVTHVFETGSALHPELSGKLLYLYQP